MPHGSGDEPVFDCQRCGACCCNPYENRELGFFEYVQVRPDDALMEPRNDELRARISFTNEKGEVHLLLTANDQRCVALAGTLGRDVRCTAYEERPTPCRTMEPGSDRCRACRGQRGIDDPPGKYRTKR